MARNILVVIWKTIAEHYIRNEGGVYLDNIGYLCHIIRPEKKFSIRGKLSKKRVMAGGYGYRHVCLQMEMTRLGRMRHYVSVDISGFMKKQCDAFILKGYKYKFLYRESLEWNRRRHINKPKRFYELRCASKTL